MKLQAKVAASLVGVSTRLWPLAVLDYAEEKHVSI